MQRNGTLPPNRPYQSPKAIVGCHDALRKERRGLLILLTPAVNAEFSRNFGISSALPALLLNVLSASACHTDTNGCIVGGTYIACYNRIGHRQNGGESVLPTRGAWLGGAKVPPWGACGPLPAIPELEWNFG